MVLLFHIFKLLWFLGRLLRSICNGNVKIPATCAIQIQAGDSLKGTFYILNDPSFEKAIHNGTRP